MASNQRHNQHLMWRAGFGPAAAQLDQLASLSPQQLFRALQKASAPAPEPIDVADDYLKGLFMGAEEIGRLQRAGMDAADRRKVREQHREDIKSLNLHWLREMVESGAQLREKAAFFWHGHFASRNLNVFYQQQLLQIIRKHALGSFRTLLHEVSRSAAILNFLNAQQNRKGHPNENFAREVMELFTMGRGHYTEQDVKEAARAFTGWGANLQGEFVFRKFQHDNGTKEVLGTRGQLQGEDVLDILLEQKQTARFIAAKLYRFYVHETAEPERVNWLADRFYQSDYNIGGLLEDIFTSSWFYDEKYIGKRIKSPVELLAGIQRLLPMEIENEEVLLLAQRLLGQLLFFPPNVAGWPGGRSWIDSASLMMRLRLPGLITEKDSLQLQPKPDDDQMMGMGARAAKAPARGGRPIIADIDWSKYLPYFNGVARKDLVYVMAASLLQEHDRLPFQAITAAADATTRESYIRSLTLQLMSIPEYQLC